ncbi:MAG TPA: hypothetical protein VM056_03660 [Terriglobales bacterium]|nr:hypothetical protein [Terriglobales bacterium]
MPPPDDTISRDRPLTIDEVRLISDLRVMHSKVADLFLLVNDLKRRHSEASIQANADSTVLAENINRIDEIYLWLVKVKSERGKRSA